MGMESRSQTITKNKKTYHWCPKHAQWCIHTPTECKLTEPKKATAPVAQETVQNKTEPHEPPKLVKVDTVLETIANSENMRYFA
jgi:hypothetical protein